MTEEGSIERIEIIQAASTLLSLRRHCEERIQWQRSRSTFFPSHHPIVNPFSYGQMWPFYKPFPYDVTPLPMMHHHSPFSFQLSPYIVGPRTWFPASQSPFPSPLRITEVTADSLPTTPISSSPPRMPRILAAVETEEGRLLHEGNDDLGAGELDETANVTNDKYDLKRKRRNLTKKQQEILEKAYCTTKYPHIEERLRLSKATQLTEDRIQIWFQNRRAKDRRRNDLTRSPSKLPTELESNEIRHQEDGLESVKVEGGMDGEVLQCIHVEPNEYCGEPSPKRIKPQP